MDYHSIVYLFVFLPAVLFLYWVTPQKKRWLILLLAGYAFFWILSGKLVIFLIGTTLVVQMIGLWIEKIQMQSTRCSREEKKKYKKREKHVLILGIIIILAVLVFLKYYNFFAENSNIWLKGMGRSYRFQSMALILPIGISFYSLQAIGYMVDVYWGKVKAEHHFGKIGLFLGFFPQIMEGPISMYNQTADALWEGKNLTSENLSQGWIRIFWGLLKKMVIADRLYMLVKMVFDHHQKYSGAIIVVAAIAYTIQLYMEFSGCMDIVIGSGSLFGITLPENFRQPFVSKNAAEFWQRWHITLGVWFKTYIFYPVSVSKGVKKWNKFGKKHFGKYVTKLGVSAMCLFPVWICNGTWHGPRWSYIFYGMYYFVILLFGIAVEPIRKKVLEVTHLDEHALYWKIPQILKTWVIIFTGELFFRAKTLTAGFEMFFSIFKDFHITDLFHQEFWLLGLDQADYMVIVIGCCIVGIVGSLKERGWKADVSFPKMRTPIRWAFYYSLIFAVIIFGAYGAGYQKVDLIYAGF